jgi:hypothetical protein
MSGLTQRPLGNKTLHGKEWVFWLEDDGKRIWCVGKHENSGFSAYGDTKEKAISECVAMAERYSAATKPK